MKSYPIMWGWLYERWYIYLHLPWIYVFPRILVVTSCIRLRQKHKPMYHTKKGLLGGGFIHIFDFHPETWGRWTHFDGCIFFKMGLKPQPPTRKTIINSRYTPEKWTAGSQQMKVWSQSITQKRVFLVGFFLEKKPKDWFGLWWSLSRLAGAIGLRLRVFG